MSYALEADEPVPTGIRRIARESAEGARQRVDDWPLSGGGFGALRGGIRKVYRRGRDRMADAYEDPTGPRFHEWRKRAKYCWYHLRILTPVWPRLLEPWAEAQHRSSDLLGEGNDLTDLVELLAEEPALAPEPSVTQELGERTRTRRREPWREAQPLGARLYAEPPDALTERLRAWWMAGRRPACPA